MFNRLKKIDPELIQNWYDLHYTKHMKHTIMKKHWRRKK
jgi:hypothetical protein